MAPQMPQATRNMNSRPPRKNKLATLPSRTWRTSSCTKRSNRAIDKFSLADALVSKRPLLRPPIASQYSNSETPKIVYVSARTPFLSAVKRVEKLLRLADKRLVQSATTLIKGKPHLRGRRAPLTKGVEAEDEIGGIAEMVGQLKDKRKPEEVIVKGTGRSIPKVMEIGIWFQQREEYAISLRTGTVSGIDDVEYEESAPAEKEKSEGESMDVDVADANHNASCVVRREETKTADGVVSVSETRIRNMSVLELRISLR